MAGSRLEKVGTVFKRVQDLMRSGVMKPKDKPIWFDVYQAFPPKRDPLYVKPLSTSGIKKVETVPDIFYREDEVRAKFYEQYTAGQALDLTKSSFVSTCQRFVDKYMELKSSTSLDDSTLFEETGKALLAQGILLRRKGVRVSAFSKDPVLNLTAEDMLAEQEGDCGDGNKTVEHRTQTQTAPTDASN